MSNVILYQIQSCKTLARARKKLARYSTQIMHVTRSSRNIYFFNLICNSMAIKLSFSHVDRSGDN